MMGARSSVVTFSKWLEEQTRREDNVGEVARIWAAAGQAGDRPKAHSPVGIRNWFRERYHEDADRLAGFNEAIELGVQEHRGERQGSSLVVVGPHEVAWRGWVETALTSLLRSVERMELVLGIDPVDGTVPLPPADQPFTAASNVTEPAATGDVPWGRLWAVADHTDQPGE
jgi:hypothetical protein